MIDLIAIENHLPALQVVVPLLLAPVAILVSLPFLSWLVALFGSLFCLYSSVSLFFQVSEFGKINVRTNCIDPELIRTNFAKALWENPEILKSALTGTPQNRIGEPDELGGAAVFLASAAGSYVNGHTIVVDGGTTV